MDAQRALADHRLVGLDTTIFIYALERNPQFSAPARSVLRLVHDAEVSAVASTLVLAEILVRPYREGRPDVAARYVDYLSTYPNLTIVPPDAEACRLAALLRAGSRSLKLADALHLATALSASATAFITNDLRLHAPPGLSLVQLTELA